MEVKHTVFIKPDFLVFEAVMRTFKKRRAEGVWQRLCITRSCNTSNPLHLSRRCCDKQTCSTGSGEKSTVDVSD